LIVAVIVVLLLAFPAVAYADSSGPAPVAAGFASPNEPDGIPTPIVDGAFHYWGNGRFTTDSGQEFFWKADHFENADGSPLAVPPRIAEKFLADGVGPIGQPTRPATDNYQDGYYRHIGAVQTVDQTIDAYQMDVNCYDRSPGYSSYGWIGFVNTNNYVLAWEAETFTQNWVVPFAHFTYQSTPDFEKEYWDYEFSVANPVSRNFKVARNSNGTWNVYLDATPLDYNLYWPYSPSSNWGRTQVELTSSSQSPPHDPANHFSNIQFRYQGTSTWLRQDSSRESVTLGRWLKDANGNYYTPAYGSIWLQYPNYDWEMTVN
jgi:hypothetical protein